MHQRNVSEFIGGDGKTGSGEILSTSPTKRPPAGRRGHAHRRSAAISVSDLSMVLKPNPGAARGSSAPNSPSGDAAYQNSPFPGSFDTTIQPTGVNGNPVATEAPVNKVPKNTRVGFSDDLEFIPPKEKRGFLSNPRISDVRPRTAEPILDQEGSKSQDHPPRRRSSLPLLTPRSVKKWSFFGHDTTSGESSPKSRPTSSASSAKESKKAETAPSSPEINTDVPFPTIEPTISRRSSMSRKPSKKQKRVKSWAGSILSRKSRQRKQKLSRRSPTPPLRYTSPIDEAPTFEFNKPDYTGPPKPEIQTDFASWKPRKVASQEESMSPIIDLDAALGPFNTPSSFGDEWDSSQKGARRKKAMHSAAGLGGFTGPGMHYHRRAESAPEFENPRFGLHRLGSSSTMGMEDVFEEDEDEEWEDSKASDKEPSIKTGEIEDEEETGLGIGIKVVDSDGLESDKSIDFEDHRGIKRKDSNLSDGRQVGSTKSLHSTTSLVDEPIEEESGSPVEIVDDSIPPRPDSGAQSSDSTATPPFRANAVKGLAPVEIQPFSLQPPYQTPASPRSIPSSFPSPRSPFSYDAQRISTAPSSITDENAFQSLLLGEPGPEVRMSVDDVPSLTSSNSTMTRESGHPGFNNPQFRDGQRSASLSSAAVTRKRSSMASLSRLISSSHGEKSKLSIENRAPTPDGEKKEKASKGKRISRMMQFWKPKDTSS
ncbi:uncharacterized protein LY89DRAFT_694092 [Mollisia scopiformis]|uniref:Cell wall proline rich protein n=1 Tax=Mollisia scopiformis TaxID=149040 RepID=A0A194XT33_MOLSC|nr:uncharacterized protein LY89DRAFT_694092 [Mollisia scopiformis]KUJ22877.1 hypothetical protein LY89DRAFT_694092 [Mollisia scopiformis]